MISVIIPIYNQADKLLKTLKSLQKQSYQDFEIIIVNDGSSDNLESVITKFHQDNSLNQSFLVLNQANAGAPAARNRGWRASQGDFLLFCDADAVLAPEALAIMLQALNNNPQASYAYSSFYWGNKLFKLKPFDAQQLKTEPCIHTMSLIRRADFPETGWDESLKKFQDWDIWLTMLAARKFGVFIDQVLFTVSPGGTISSWLPSFAYKSLPFLPQVKKYQAAKNIILKKHGLV